MNANWAALRLATAAWRSHVLREELLPLHSGLAFLHIVAIRESGTLAVTTSTTMGQVLSLIFPLLFSTFRLFENLSAPASALTVQTVSVSSVAICSQWWHLLGLKDLFEWPKTSLSLLLLVLGQRNVLLFLTLFLYYRWLDREHRRSAATIIRQEEACRRHMHTAQAIKISEEEMCVHYQRHYPELLRVYQAKLAAHPDSMAVPMVAGRLNTFEFTNLRTALRRLQKEQKSSLKSLNVAWVQALVFPPTEDGLQCAQLIQEYAVWNFFVLVQPIPVNGLQWIEGVCEALVSDGAGGLYQITNIPFHRRQEILEFLIDTPDIESGAFFLEDAAPSPGYLLEYIQTSDQDGDCPQCNLISK